MPGISGIVHAASASKRKLPNIICIYTDQQSATMMSCAGNKWLKTPAMDYIAANGIRFTRAYASNPVCSPARVSWMTGRFAGSFKDGNGNPARENAGSMRIGQISDDLSNTTIAAFLKRAGYDLVYGGKEHLPGPLNAKSLGFKDICNNERDKLADEAAKFIKEKHDKPYFMAASFINPHDICFMALHGWKFDKPELRNARSVAEKKLDKAMKIPDGMNAEEFFARHCPPLPPNHEPQQGEPKAIKSLLLRRPFRMKTRREFSDKDWRLHRWAYHRLTEVVDRQIQTVLDALKESGQEENTVVIFSSDHGDMDSAHKMEHKTALYEESANVPFMAMWKGHIPPGQVNGTHLVSSGLDLLPTVCDYADVKGVADPRGKSLRPLFESKKVEWRNTLGVESEIGRMVIRKDKLKYVRYDAEGKEEQLLDLNKDPYETTHFTDDQKYASELAKMRKAFDSEWFPGC